MTMLWGRTLLARYEAATSGYLDAMGWFRTRAARRALDARGAPIPWFTYPAIALLSERIDAGWRVLEFGSGMGTLWWSQRVADHVAIEHDAAWAELIAKQTRATIHRVDGATAAAYVAPVEGQERFDVVIVDGIHRNECLLAARDLVVPDGIVILDDAQRPEYASGVDALRAAGFRILPLHGPQPVSKHAGCTAILYRPDNVLGL